MSDYLMVINQGATVIADFPATDADGNPLDLTTLTDVCFLLSGAGRKIEKHNGDTGFEFTDNVGSNDNLRITLSTAETILPDGRLYKFWAWGTGVDGRDVLAYGEAEVIKTERCES